MADKEAGIFYSRAEYVKAYNFYAEERRKKQSRKRYLRNRHILKVINKTYRKRNQKKFTQWQIRWNKAHPDSILNMRLKLNWGITLDEYMEKLRNQNGKCAICFKKETTRNNYDNSKVKRLAVDHCHKTGRIRGLLCNNCNQALGRFNDSIRIMKNAINYLRNN